MNELVSLPDTRTEVIGRYVFRLTRETRTSLEDYSEMVLRMWLQRTPESARSDDFHMGSDVLKRMAANTQKIRRWFNPQVAARPSIDVEEALVMALPQPYRAECKQALAARYGGLFWQLPDGAQPSIECASALLAASGEALTALAPAFANDRKIDENDDPAVLLKARAELLDVQAVVLSFVASIDAALETQRANAAHAAPRLRSVA